MNRFPPIDGLVVLSVNVLADWCSPFCGACWEVMECAMTRAEVQAALSDPLHPNFGPAKSRQDHARRIAWFVLNPDLSEPIEVDVGVPHMGCFVRWPVTDGNHRFAAAIFRGDLTIIGSLGGSWNHADEIGLLVYD